MILLYLNNKGADRPAHPRSLISGFFIRFIESAIAKLDTSTILDSLYSSACWIEFYLVATAKIGFLVLRLLRETDLNVDLYTAVTITPQLIAELTYIVLY